MQNIKKKLIAICFIMCIVVAILPQNVGAGIVEQPYLTFDDNDILSNSYSIFNNTGFDDYHNFSINFDLKHIGNGVIFAYHSWFSAEGIYYNYFMCLAIDGAFLYGYTWYNTQSYYSPTWYVLAPLIEKCYLGAINETTNFDIDILFNLETNKKDIVVNNNYAEIEKTFNTNIVLNLNEESIYLSAPEISFSDVAMNNINGYDNIQYIATNETEVEQLNYTIDFSEYTNPTNTTYYFSNNETIKDNDDNVIMTFRISSPAVAYAGEYTAVTGATIIMVIWENEYIRYGVIILAVLVGLTIWGIWLDHKKKK